MGNILKRKTKKINKYSEKKNKKRNCYEYKFKPEVVTITYNNKYGHKVINGDRVKYSYIYKGVPGGWYFK